MNFTDPTGSKPLVGYSIKRGIGRGAFGEVYYAVSDGGKDVALKLIQQHVDVELRGVRECLNLEHPNLVRLYDVQQTPAGESWVVMEYCDGESLEEAIAAHPHGMPLDEVLRWFRGICAGVGFLHEHGIVHRDLKPSHIFLENGVVKICDYGLAKFISVSRRSGNTDGVGTVFYAAPEIAKGKYGTELDLYSIGVMLYEALSGDVPFDGQTAAEILMKHLTEQPDVSHFPSPYKQIIAKLLEKEPSRRYRTTEELTQTFDTPITAKPSLPSFFEQLPICSQFYDRIQPRKRAGQVVDLVKRNKLASLACCGLLGLTMLMGIVIGEASRGHRRSYYGPYAYGSIERLSNVQVKRNDGVAATVRLSDISLFHPISRTDRRRRSITRSPAYQLVVDQKKSEILSVGHREILESLWDAGFEPIIEIELDKVRAAERGVTIQSISASLQEFAKGNHKRQKSCRISRSPNGFTVQFSQRREVRSSGGIVDFYPIKPEAVFDLTARTNGKIAKARVPLSEFVEFRIIACGTL